jgi:hypothetical protein
MGSTRTDARTPEPDDQPGEFHDGPRAPEPPDERRVAPIEDPRAPWEEPLTVP